MDRQLNAMLDDDVSSRGEMGLADEVAERAAEALLEHGRGALRDVGPAALAARDEPGIDQLADGLTDGGAADGELGGETVFRREPGAGRVHGVRDPLSEHARDLVVQRER